MAAICCLSCDAALGGPRDAVASLCVQTGGDEVIFSYFLCEPCQEWTAEQYRDRFTGDAEISSFGPLPADEGRLILALIERCPDPTNKRCSCVSHLQLLSGRPTPP